MFLPGQNFFPRISPQNSHSTVRSLATARSLTFTRSARYSLASLILSFTRFVLSLSFAHSTRGVFWGEVRGKKFFSRKEHYYNYYNTIRQKNVKVFPPFPPFAVLQYFKYSQCIFLLSLHGKDHKYHKNFWIAVLVNEYVKLLNL